MKFYDSRNGAEINGLEEALGVMLQSKTDDRPVADWFDDLKKVWVEGEFRLGYLVAEVSGPTIPTSETDGNFIVEYPQRLRNADKVLIRAQNGTREYSAVRADDCPWEWGVRVRSVGDGREFYLLLVEPTDSKARALGWVMSVAELASAIATDIMMPLQRLVESRYGFRSSPAFWQSGPTFRHVRSLATAH